jgi:hypothetical protein
MVPWKFRVVPLAGRDCSVLCAVPSCCEFECIIIRCLRNAIHSRRRFVVFEFEIARDAKRTTQRLLLARKQARWTSGVLHCTDGSEQCMNETNGRVDHIIIRSKQRESNASRERRERNGTKQFHRLCEVDISRSQKYTNPGPFEFTGNSTVKPKYGWWIFKKLEPFNVGSERASQ